jgi:hypothetical protein
MGTSRYRGLQLGTVSVWAEPRDAGTVSTSGLTPARNPRWIDAGLCPVLSVSPRWDSMVGRERAGRIQKKQPIFLLTPMKTHQSQHTLITMNGPNTWSLNQQSHHDQA